MNIKEIKKELKERVAKGLNFGIEALEEVIDDSAIVYNDFVLLKSKYNDLIQMSSINTIPYDQIEIGIDRLRVSLIGIINDLENRSLKKQDIDSDLKVQALPTRRANFFQLLDIHFRNLDAIKYVEIYNYDSDRYENKRIGREAVWELYAVHLRKFRHKEYESEELEKKEIENHFYEYFKNEYGLMEVYFKNIKHMMAYVLDSEIEKGFFLNILKSLFSKYELAMLFYYAVSKIDLQFLDLIKKSQLIEKSIEDILIDKKHFLYIQDVKDHKE